MNDAGGSHVCLVGRQPLPNALGVLALRPAHVTLLASAEEDAVRVRLANWLRGCRIPCDVVRVDFYDAGAVREACRHVLRARGDARIALNATGGTKIAALSAIAAFQDHPSAESFYVNTERDRIEWLRPPVRAPTPLAVRLRLEDYLRLHGFVLASSEERRAAVDGRWEATRLIAENAVAVAPLLRYFRVLARAASQAQEPLDGIGERHRDRAPADPGRLQLLLLDTLERGGFVRRAGGAAPAGAVASVCSEDALAYLAGGWLEEYVYRTFLDLRDSDGRRADEVHMNAVLRWGEQGTPHTVTNEIDVVALHRARLWMVSCKSGATIGSPRHDDLAQDELFKLEALRELAGGAYGRAVLVAGVRLKDRVKARCARLGIEYVDGNDLRRLAEHARRWMRR